jgi:glycosyltransferase involved in cell wall biosynthesis
MQEGDTQEPLNILHVTYDMRIGGTEQVIKNLIENLPREKFNCSIFCIEGTIGPWGKQLQDRGIEIAGHIRKPGFDTALIRSLRTHINSRRIDVVHCHQYTPYVYGFFAALFTRAKVIFTEHGRFYPDTSSWKRRLINPFLSRFTDAITAISKATRQALVDYESIQAKRIKVIYNGIADLAAKPIVYPLELEQRLRNWPHQQKPLVFGTIARLDSIKNQAMMLHAFGRVLAHHANSLLLIVGDGPERENLTSLASELSITDNVIFTGYIESPLNLLRQIDVYLLSSLSEGTSMTLLEAMGLSKPCIVTDAGGNAEVIQDGENGIVTKNDDVCDFANAMEKLIQNPGQRDAMATKARHRYLDYFTAELMCRSYEEIYAEVCW